MFVPNHNAKILVVGDVILDRYVYGDTSRISPEAPVPIVHVKNTEERPGGAGNVALNIKHLGMDVCLVGITGDDAAAELLQQSLTSEGVECVFTKQDGFPTITKLRVLSQHQQLLRLDYEAKSDEVKADALDKLFSEQLDESEIIVLSDYAKGSLANVNYFIQQSVNAGKRVLIDPKGTDFSRYQGATIITPNLKELEAIVGSCHTQEDIAEKGTNLLGSLSLEALLVTRGGNGMTLITKNAPPIHLNALAHEVYDVTGAGDTVIATMAAALASGYDFAQSTSFANHAAGLSVEKLGASTINVSELNNTISKPNFINEKMVNLSSLQKLLESIRSENRSIVMTNGCFDILHAGHVKYLNDAKALGDYLIVAVNDDDSVSRLKGKNRPVNNLQHRKSVLAALESVDWVISFSENTPEKLISEINPDFLVKGGDYDPDEIAGARAVKEKGGKTVIIPLFEDCSSSQIINKIKTDN